MSPFSLERVYLRLPTLVQQAAVTAEGWRVERNRYRPPFTDVLAAYEDRAQWDSLRLSEWRDARLRSFITAAAALPLYSRWFAESRVAPADIRQLDDLRRLPILTKAIVREAQDTGTLSSATADDATFVAHTSGTTGAGLRFLVTTASAREQWAAWWRYRHAHGIRRGTWCAVFGGRSLVPIGQRRPPFWRVNVAAKQVMFSAYHITPETVCDYVAELRRRRLPWLHGYPSVISLIAGYLVDRGESLGYQVGWITFGAENVMPHQLALAAAAFGVQPRQHYGMSEGVANFSECPLGRLHVDEDFAAVEFVPRGDGTGAIIGTNFTNLATPLIRYEVGDFATPATDACQCGRGGRIVVAVDGRLEDYVLLPNGARVGRLDHVFKDMLVVREAQLVQRRVDALEVRIVRAAGFDSAAEAAIRREFAQRLGDMRIVIEYVDALPRTNTGKLRFVVSELPEGRLQRTTIQ